VVGSDDEAKEADGHYSSYYPHIPEGLFLTSIEGNNVGDHAESGEDENVDFRVAEESEQVLVEDRVPSSCGVEECCV